jgi:hypothetical protein
VPSVPARSPTQAEIAVLEKLKLRFGEVGTFAITATGLGKSIFDARMPIPSILSDHGVHHYDQQPYGPDNRHITHCTYWDGSQNLETIVSFYRSNTRGDKRFSFPAVGGHALADDIGAFVVEDVTVRLINVTAVARETGGMKKLEASFPVSSALLPPGLSVIPVPQGTSRQGQGLMMSAAARAAMERYSRDLAIEYFTSRGWELIAETSGSGPFDLRFQREEEQLYVEVKSTTSSALVVTVTRNEVASAEQVPTALFVVTECEVATASDGSVSVTGGVRWVQEGWKPQSSSLEALTYRHTVSDAQRLD